MGVHKINVDLTLTVHNKDNTPIEIYQKIFHDLIMNKYSSYKRIFTDGSIINLETGCAFTDGVVEKGYHLTKGTSIFTAELFAIKESIKFASSSENEKFLICTDSLSSLQVLQQIYPKHPLAIEIKDIIIKNKDKIFVLLWVPSHCKITGNDAADKLAKEATKKEHFKNFKLYFKDLKSTLSKSIFLKRNQEWTSQTNNKLREIKPNTQPWISIGQFSRKNSIILTRLRIGHTKLTHEYLISQSDPPICTCSTDTIVSVKHIFETCALYTHERNIYNITGLDILSSENCIILENSLKFLKSINIFHKI